MHLVPPLVPSGTTTVLHHGRSERAHTHGCLSTLKNFSLISHTAKFSGFSRCQMECLKDTKAVRVLGASCWGVSFSYALFKMITSHFPHCQ